MNFKLDLMIDGWSIYYDLSSDECQFIIISLVNSDEGCLVWCGIKKQLLSQFWQLCMS